MLLGTKAVFIVIIAFFGLSTPIIPNTVQTGPVVAISSLSKTTELEPFYIPPAVISSSTENRPENAILEPTYVPPVIINVQVYENVSEPEPVAGTMPTSTVQSAYMEPTLEFNVTASKEPDVNGKTPFLLKAVYVGDEIVPFSLLVNDNPNELDSGDTSNTSGFIRKEGNVWTYERGLSFASTTKFTFKAGNITKIK